MSLSEIDRSSASLAAEETARVPSLAGTKAVILAGGRGTRLAPYTSILPKPLMPIGDRAILELVVDQLEHCGIIDITFCVGHLAHLIQTVFENRATGSAEITYVHEREPLGTAGPLQLVSGLDDTFLVMNGDLLSDIEYHDLVAFHRQQGNMLTIATHRRLTTLDYGVLQVDTDGRIRGFAEKPEILSTVSMGIYILEPDALAYVPTGSHFDFPDLVNALFEHDHPVGAYAHDGLWFDIGRREDYEHAASIWLTHEQSRDELAQMRSEANQLQAG